MRLDIDLGTLGGSGIPSKSLKRGYGQAIAQIIKSDEATQSSGGVIQLSGHNCSYLEGIQGKNPLQKLVCPGSALVPLERPLAMYRS